ncbi:delta(1)-pyrroline-2-carboxylate reductase family protein [Pusillimonas sp. TS35]|uniref:delta(1)-pyrroline-2-carboxylate reductase family protein n=1 Tax=Paracandidimonas lactea TaxID=2895524 RepID=UPI001367C682|nr:delta(1)-pyrroline-2-carboxylate reductase family protein [Paracandidimonas lactea]MYN12899.1 delta(1)-pyrroline-2-carboxylate reductase family protein [Pusillimonas sp. TS35]
MTKGAITVYDAAQTALRLPFALLLDDLAQAARDLAAGAIHAPERQVLEYPGGGVMLSMPATARDIGVHKLVNVVPANRDIGLPTINGIVTAYDGATGCARFVLDGPTVTARRTAGISMLGLRTLMPGTITHAAIIGTGTEAASHAEALAALYPGLRIAVIGRRLERAQAFSAMHTPGLQAELLPAERVPNDTQVVITVTTSATPVYDAAPQAGRLVIGVGAYRPDLAEIGPATIAGSRLYADDLAGARHEAGDFLQAGVDWQTVTPLSSALDQPPPAGQAMIFKTVGCAAWDLAAARCVTRAIKLE